MLIGATATLSSSSGIMHANQVDLGSDTIFALATTPPGKQGSGIAIIRVSGPDAFDTAAGLCNPPIRPDDLPDHEFTLRSFSHDGGMIDRAGLLPFRGPHSYTGEDVVEIHCHGGLAVIRAFERVLISLGVRPAEPGEFTRRAFLNGRIDLVQAEAIAAMVGAAGDAARREALRRHTGRLSMKVESIREILRDLLGRLEVDFDYPEERIDGLESNEAVELIDSILESLSPLSVS